MAELWIVPPCGQIHPSAFHLSNSSSLQLSSLHLDFFIHYPSNLHPSIIHYLNVFNLPDTSSISPQQPSAIHGHFAKELAGRNILTGWLASLHGPPFLGKMVCGGVVLSLGMAYLPALSRLQLGRLKGIDFVLKQFAVTPWNLMNYGCHTSVPYNTYLNTSH